MLKIFVASSYREFRREREVVIDIVERLGLESVVMENFGASEAAPIDVCIQAVTAADVVLFMFGRSYGSVPPGETKSFTHVEIETALNQKTPIIPYLCSKGELHDLFRSESALPEDYIQLVRSLGDRHTIKRCASLSELSHHALVDIAGAVNRLTQAHIDPLSEEVFTSGFDALRVRDFASARRAFWRLAASDDARARRWIALTELASSRSSGTVGQSLKLFNEAALRGDAKSQAIIRAFLTCCPSWLDAE